MTSHAGIFSGIGLSIARGVTSIMNHTATALNRVVNVFSECEDSSVDGIATKCFDRNERAKIRAGIEMLQSRNYAFVVSGKPVHAYQHFKQHTKRLVNWDSKQMRMTYLPAHRAGCNGNSVLGCYTLDGTTFLTALGLNLDAAKMSGLLLHEATHFDRSHSCGRAADKDLDGPYGYEAIYLMSIANNSTDTALTPSLRALARSRAATIAQYQLCDNTTARYEVLSYTNSERYQIKPVQSPLKQNSSSIATAFGQSISSRRKITSAQ